MKADTRLFGKIEIEDEKILTFDQGIIGFPYMKHFALIFDVGVSTIYRKFPANKSNESP